ncbi:BlaI/MecI/CopY family transcriptional regulator [Roseateles paludis]|jgi:predicted transcriptional regulator|uniref:BlaI/MecI/CopY family transcriptional regulator n=1 Tax=Roseateles paludis TaxID=3145238 RepID=A0ABV0G049_9BURK
MPQNTPPLPPLPTISEAESQVMLQLWREHPQSAEQLALSLMPEQGWQLSTIKTLLNRLLQKGAIAADKDGRRFLYRPLVAEADWLKSQSLSLIDRWFGGGLAPLVAQFASHRKLSAEDLTALKELIKEQDRG